jgi:CheY-like chemotaxis protein
VLPAAVSGPRPASAGIRGLRVLIAEDNEMNSLILSNILDKEGCSSVIAENGQRAVDIFKTSANGEFTLILMDAQMPVMDGYAAAREIRGLARPDASLVRIFACTANTTQEDRDRAREAGMNGFLAKPIDVAKLFEVLDSCSRKDDSK